MENLEFLKFSGELKKILEDSNTANINPDTVKPVVVKSINKGIVGQGKLILTTYKNPKTKNLKYFHVIPPVITLRVLGPYMTGLNLFYLPRKTRKFCLEIMMSRMTNPSGDNFPKSLIDYDLIRRSTPRRAAFSPAVKNYALDRSGYFGIEFHRDLWEEVFFGGIGDKLEGDFEGAGKQEVYEDSLKRILKELTK